MAADDRGGSVRKVRFTIFILSALIGFAVSTFAHDSYEHSPSVFTGIEISQIINATVLILTFLVYLTGLLRLWSVAGRGHGVSFRAAGSFLAGWASLVVATIGPFHRMSETLFSAHMTQHEMLMLISAPLIVLGRPQITSIWFLPAHARSNVAAVINDRTFKTVWKFVSGGFVAFLIHGAALWVWHIPVLFDATLTSEAVHAMQHASFFGTALLFWWAIVNSAAEWKSSFVAVLFLFLTSLHSGVLGAFLTFTREVWYTAYLNSTTSWSLTPLDDQQLGGLIMWVPAGIVYIGAGLIMFAHMLAQTERRALEIDRRFLTGGL
jgi:putative membrane protein